MKKITLSALALAVSFVGIGPVSAGEISPDMLANTCAGCHGTEGASKGEAPSIDGFSREYLADTMKAYKNGSRYATVMDRIAKGYSDAQIDALALYFSSRPWADDQDEIDQELARKGQKLHVSKGCSACHGPAGISQIPNTPRLAGQYPMYLTYTMQDFADPDKAIPPKAMAMRSMLKGMSTEDMRALAEFYASQKNLH